MERIDLVQAIRNYAKKNYDDWIWCFVEDCWTDEDIARVIGDAESWPIALRRTIAVLEVYEDRLADAENSAF